MIAPSRPAASAAAAATVTPLSARLRAMAARLDGDLLLLAARVAIAATFWRSGRTKVDGWLSVTDEAVALFRDEYALPVLAPVVAAHLAAWAEHLFPAMLAAGAGTRTAALALLGMTAVIQLGVYPDAWPTHLTWAVPLVLLVARGGGRFALDRALRID